MLNVSFLLEVLVFPRTRRLTLDSLLALSIYVLSILSLWPLSRSHFSKLVLRGSTFSLSEPILLYLKS